MKWTCLLTMLVIVAALMGCANLPMKPPAPPLALTPGQQLTQMVSSTNWVVTLMLFGVGAAFFAFLNGSNKGLQAMAACLVVLSLTLGIARYSLLISATTMVGAVCLMIHTVLVKNKALKEVVKGVQGIRDTAKDDSQLGGAIDGVARLIDRILDKAQSATTKQVVRETKATL